MLHSLVCIMQNIETHSLVLMVEVIVLYSVNANRLFASPRPWGLAIPRDFYRGMAMQLKNIVSIAYSACCCLQSDPSKLQPG